MTPHPMEGDMKRYASHFLFFPDYGYLERHAVEVCRGRIVRIFPLEEEVESTEWLPGVIALLADEEGDLSMFGRGRHRLQTIPPTVEKKLPLLYPVLFSPFDFTTMRPVAGTRHRPLR